MIFKMAGSAASERRTSSWNTPALARGQATAREQPAGE